MRKLVFFTLIFANFFSKGLADLYVGEVDYLFWNVSQTNMTYALIVESTETFGDPVAQNQSDNWTSGIRLSACYYLPCSWDSKFSWTYLQNTEEDNTSNPVIVATQLLAPNVNFIVGGDGIGGPVSSKWDLKFNMFDLNFGFILLGTSIFNFHPYIGVKAGSINQHEFICYRDFVMLPDTPVNATVNIGNKFWGVGTKAGFDASLWLGGGFNLVGDFAMAALYGNHISTATTNIDSAGMLMSSRFSSERNRLLSLLELFIGLDWETNFYRHPLTLGVGYEVHYFWSAWKVQNSTIQNFFITNVGSGDLMFNGITVKAALGF